MLAHKLSTQQAVEVLLLHFRPPTAIILNMSCLKRILQQTQQF